MDVATTGVILPHILAAISAAALTRRGVRHRPIAWLLAYDVAVSLARPWLQSVRSSPEAHAARLLAREAGAAVPPYVGAARWAWACEVALGFGWRCAAAWAVWRVLTNRQTDRE